MSTKYNIGDNVIISDRNKKAVALILFPVKNGFLVEIAGNSKVIQEKNIIGLAYCKEKMLAEKFCAFILSLSDHQKYELAVKLAFISGKDNVITLEYRELCLKPVEIDEGQNTYLQEVDRQYVLAGLDSKC